MKKKKLIISLLLSFLVVTLTAGIFLFVKHDTKAEQIESPVVVIEEKPEPTVEELYPDLQFGDWVAMSEDKIDYSELMKINGYILEEYTKDNIATQIRVHDDVIHFMNSSIILEECDDPETAFYVYDDPSKQNYIFTLEEYKDFSTKKIRIDKNLVTGEYMYWLYVKQGELEGWTLMANTTKMISRVYEDDSLNAMVVFFPYDKKKRPFYVLNVRSGCELGTGIYIQNQPLYVNSDSIYIEGTFDSPERIEKFISIKAVAVEKPEYLDDPSKIWYLVVSGDKKGWEQGSSSFSLGRGGGLIHSADYVIAYYYGDSA